MNILLLNGPNLNLLGTREPETYGSITLSEIERNLTEVARKNGANALCFQSNHEGALIDRIHQARGEQVNMIIINAGALTHTSIGLRDALVGVNIPYIEVHISNVYQRESFRHHSFLAEKALGVIAGLGVHGYELALLHALRLATKA